MPCLSKLAQPSYRGKDNDFFLSGINTIDPAKAHLDGDYTSAPHEHFSPGFALAPNKDPCSHIRHSPPLPERHDDFTAGWELLQQGTVSFHRQTAWLKTHTSHQITHSDLARLSSRPYSIRVSDPSDFASIWETVVVPRLVDLLQRHRMSEFAVDVHNFPEISSQAVPRIIHIALQHPNSINAETGSHESESLEQAIQSELTRIVPGRFAPLYVQFERGIRIQKSNWWGGGKGQTDKTCEPKNVTYRIPPVMGISIGPVKVRDAASLGGFIKVGSDLYAMSAFHAFEDSVKACHLRVSHPAEADMHLLEPPRPNMKPYGIGSVAMWARPGTLRPSLTHQGTNIPRDRPMVEMDWCLIGPVEKGKNIVTVPSIQMDRFVAVENTAAVEGNTEVFAIARTSGYSLGFTSDVPGLQRISGKLRREWAVRQYSLSGDPKNYHGKAPWQTLRGWAVSGIGVPGDSGAWLVRRSDNALIGLIWGRNHDHGNPLERIRLAYFTPMVDILADIRQNHAEGEAVELPSYSAEDLKRVVEVGGPWGSVLTDMSMDPWSVFALNAARKHCQPQEDLIQKHCLADTIPGGWKRPALGTYRYPTSLNGESTDLSTAIGLTETSVAVDNLSITVPRGAFSTVSSSDLRSVDNMQRGLEGDVAPNLSLPGLTTSSSVDTVSNVADGTSEAICKENDIQVVAVEGKDQDDLDIMEAEKPIRAKARFTVLKDGQDGRTARDVGLNGTGRRMEMTTWVVEDHMIWGCLSQAEAPTCSHSLLHVWLDGSDGSRDR